MPILQNRLKLLIDAAANREAQLVELYSQVQRVLDYSTDASWRIDLQTTLHICRAYLIKDATIAKEQEHYRLTHNRNITRRERIKNMRESFRIEHGLPAKVRDTGYDTLAAQGMPKPSPEITVPIHIPKTIEQKYKEIMLHKGLQQYYIDKYGETWMTYLPGQPNYNPIEDDEDYEQ